MATPIDTVVIGHILPVITFLLVFTIAYALFSRADMLKDRNLDLLAAFTISILFLFTPNALTIIEIATPWFMLFVVFLVLIFTTFLFLGYKQEGLHDLIRTPTVYYPILIVMIGIFLFALSQVFGEQVQAIFGEGGPSEEDALLTQIVGVVLHPRLLSAVFILLVAALAIRLIAAPTKQD